MDTELQERIRTMSAAHLVEAAEMILPELLEIDEFADAAPRVAALAGFSAEQADEISRLAQEAAAKSQHEITAVLRLVLADIVKAPGENQDEIRHKLMSAGHKQIVVGPELFVLGALLIAGYIVFVNKGVIRKKKTITIEEQKDGRRKITIGSETDILNPLNPLSNLLDRILGGS